MIITGSNPVAVNEVKCHLFREFEMKDLDLGPLRYFLGIEVAFSPKGYLLGQSKYAIDILHLACPTNTKTVDTPLELHAKFSTSDGVPLEDPTKYFQAVGAILSSDIWSVFALSSSSIKDRSSTSAYVDNFNDLTSLRKSGFNPPSNLRAFMFSSGIRCGA
ncbi:hypothetical protein RHSIM_Rhsim02G0124000 [Rhododendron simsii]|uniref:Reverse transcriptase Ty1/copia-type domain-containing protein n=1 Tax=Rhododendron simsii TaxID=118357 RepID=A0A834H837_RHOSS|nr:hypothetical protein RHSIM_Rhsim02G0124000 [Rhododendron simsii]